ncbi:MAG TPA: TolC family protein [Nannocystis exedens]|nr:TolC family protein [Nannocystis exedens]
MGCAVAGDSAPRGAQRPQGPDRGSFQPSSPPTVELPADGRIRLAEALSYAESRAPEVLLAQGQLALGEAEVSAAEQLQRTNPTLSLGLGQRRQGQGRGLEAEVAISQQLEIAGQRKRRREAASRYQELLRLGLDAASWQVHAEVHSSFERALLADDVSLLAERIVAFDSELLAMAKRRVEVGDEARVIVEVARAELAISRSMSAVAARGVTTSRLALARAIGWTGSQLQPLGPAGPIAAAGDREALVRQALAQSPHLQRAEKQIEVARARAEASRREAWPSPTVGLSYAREGATTTPGNFNPASDVWMGTIQVPIPAFARNQGAIARRRAEVRVAESESRVLSLNLATEIGIAAAHVDVAAARIEALSGSVVPAFERGLAALQRSYEVGELDFLAVAQAREQMWNARSQVLSARAEYYDALANLERLVGPIEQAAQDRGELR